MVAVGFRRRCHPGIDLRYPIFNLSWFSPIWRQGLFAESQRMGPGLAALVLLFGIYTFTSNGSCSESADNWPSGNTFFN